MYLRSFFLSNLVFEQLVIEQPVQQPAPTSDFEPHQGCGSQAIQAITHHLPICSEVICPDIISNHILPASDASALSAFLYQDFIWRPEPAPALAQTALAQTALAQTALAQTATPAQMQWETLPPVVPLKSWNSAGLGLIGLAILPGLWLSYLSLSADSLPHYKLLLGLELLLIGLQLFGFSLALALLIETHQRFPHLVTFRKLG